MSSVQDCQVMVPSTVLPESTVTSCEKTALSKKTRSSLYGCGFVTSCSGPAVTGLVYSTSTGLPMPGFTP